MAEAVEAVPSAGEELSRAGPSSAALALDADERRQDELRKRERDPPIVYTDIDVSTATRRMLPKLARYLRTALDTDMKIT